jgi:hypothetical protein
MEDRPGHWLNLGQWEHTLAHKATHGQWAFSRTSVPPLSYTLHTTQLLLMGTCLAPCRWPREPVLQIQEAGGESEACCANADHLCGLGHGCLLSWPQFPLLQTWSISHNGLLRSLLVPDSRSLTGILAEASCLTWMLPV